MTNYQATGYRMQIIRGATRLSMVLIAVAGCGGEARSIAMRTDSAGIEIVRNPLPMRLIEASLDTLGLFGGDEQGLGSFYRVRRPLIDVDSAGRIYILDTSQHRVVAYSADGTPLQAWGREGEGPGELSAPLSVTVSRTGEVIVHDAGRGIFSRHAWNGSFIGQDQAPGVLNVNLRQAEAVAGGLVMWARYVDPELGERLDRLLWVRGNDTTVLVAGKPAHRSTAHHERCGVTFGVRVPLSPDIYWAESSDRVAVAADADYRVDIFDAGRLIRRVWVGEPVRELTREEVVSLLEAEGVIGPCNSQPVEFIRLHGYYPKAQVIRGITLAPDGRLWVLHRNGQGGELITMFDEGGEALGNLPSGFPMPLGFLPDGRALLQVVDSFGLERVGIARVSLKER